MTASSLNSLKAERHNSSVHVTSEEHSEEPAVAALRDRFYRPELDALRLLAFLLVFAVHASPDLRNMQHSQGRAFIETVFRIGNFGLCLFFFLSSYLITELLNKERAATGTLHIKAFYLRRVLRIWPLYFSFLFIGGWISVKAFGYPLEMGRLLAFAGLAGNWYVARHGFGLNPIFPLWSISIEEQFYLLWPFIAKWRGRTGVIAASWILLIVSAAALVALGTQGADRNTVVWVSTLVQFQFFCLGALTATILNRRVPVLSGITRAALLAGAVVLWLIAAGPLHVKTMAPQNSWWELLCGYGLVSVGCLAVFFSILGVSKRRIPSWIIYLGKISYGLYVFHVFALYSILWISKLAEQNSVFLVVHHQAFGLARDGAALVLAVIMAHYSYKFLESPFLRLKDRFAFIHSRSV
jgi:peptidoglycan/LPS O-acetylase OafA/YrhL